MSITIRRGEKIDIEDLIRVIRNIGWHRSESSDESLYLHFQQIFNDYEKENHDIFVAQQKNRVVGYIAVHWINYLIFEGSEGYISELFVDPAWSNQGIGTALLDTVKTEGVKRESYRLSLLNNKSRESYLRQFYQKYGFTERDHMASLVLIL